MRRVTVGLPTLAAIGALAACGGSSSSSSSSSSPSAVLAGPPTVPTAGLPTCASRVRTTSGAPVVKPGPCTASGITLDLAAAGQPVALKTLGAREDGARLTQTVSSPVATRTASGTFLVVTLAVSNRQTTPAAFDAFGATQTALQASSMNFREDVDAETGADLGSCLARSMTPIKAGATESCDVIFDVPRAVAGHLRLKGGGLLVLNFGDSIDTVTRSVTEPGLLTLGPVR